MPALFRQFARFAAKPLPDQLTALEAGGRLILHNAPYLGRRFEQRYKARLFGELAPLVPSIEDMFDGPRSFKAAEAIGWRDTRIPELNRSAISVVATREAGSPVHPPS